MKHLITALVTVSVFGTALFVHHRNRRTTASVASSMTRGLPALEPSGEYLIRASGRIEGREEAIELRARMSEQIREIHVKRGQRVTAGEALVSLDSERLVSERDLATALLQEAKAKKERLRNGYLPSEIETARQQYQASMEEVAGAEKAYDRALKLRQQNAISQQSIDDLYSQLNSLRAKANAARSSFETLDAPPRDDELLAAEAAVGAAQARLRIAQISLDRAVIYAPASGRILALEARIGELTSPDSSEPLVVLSDTSNLRAVAEVDEYDALRVRLGQVCEIRSDAADGVIARGKVVEIEPQMNPKRMFGQWAGERTDTFSRRVWIELESSGDNDLPIGLPVDVYIHAEVSP